MNIFFLDVLGDREWAAISGSCPLASMPDMPTRGDIVFIHISDFLKTYARNFSRVPDQDRPSLEKMREVLHSHKRIGDGRAGVVFYTGSAVVAPDEEKDARSILCEHEEHQLAFMPRMDRGMTSGQLGDRLFPVAEEYERQNCRNLKGIISGLSTQSEAAELQMAFRILWQTYVLYRTGPEQLPEELRPVHQKLQESVFDERYWSPILRDNRLNERLAEDVPDDISDAITAIRDIRDWNAVPIPDEIINKYRVQWLA